jgi:glycosyltransferase involved in cell wall biosynthesis
LKILQLCNKAPFPANDGSSIAIYNMARGLIQNGVELHLLTINTKKHFKPTENIPDEFLKNTNYEAVFRNTDTSFSGMLLNLFSNQSYFESRFFFPEFEHRLIEKLNEIQFDVIQLEGLFMCSYISTIRKYSTAKIVLRAHNVEHIIWERHIQSEKNILKRYYLKIQNKRLKKSEIDHFKQVDAVIPITPTDQEWIEKYAAVSRIKTVLTGVDLGDYSLQRATDFEINSIFYFGSMDWIPNQQAVWWFLDNCWTRILESIPECKFVIAGRNIPEEFKRLVEQNIVIQENVEDPIEIYSKYNVMLVPLQSGSGLRIKIVEGLSYGKAIVSTNVGAEGISIESGKNIQIADDLNEFSLQVIQILQNTEKRLCLERNARAFAAENLDNTKITSTLVAFYQNLIQA